MLASDRLFRQTRACVCVRARARVTYKSVTNAQLILTTIQLKKN